MFTKHKRIIYGISAALAVIAAVSAVTFVNIAEAKYTGVTRDFYIFSIVDEHIEEREEELGIPPDQFSQTQITVRKGDKVRIHFYNLEPVEEQEHHTFTILEKPYEMSHDLNAGENKVIEFVATERGIWTYVCTYHEPTMRGQLVVWP